MSCSEPIRTQEGHSIRLIPEGYGSLTSALVVTHRAEAIELDKQAFGAQELARLPAPLK